jgi:arabinan endo-1,5-alpha-L-arabinosidase
MQMYVTERFKTTAKFQNLANYETMHPITNGSAIGSGVGVFIDGSYSHDPTLLKTPNGEYIVYASDYAENDRHKFRIGYAPRGLYAARSWDLKHWTRVCDTGAFSPNALPTWTLQYTATTYLVIWGPSAHLYNGTYYLLYCAAQFGTSIAAIGLATSATGVPGTFVDVGKILETNATSGFNALDPDFIYDPVAQKYYLTFGSFFSGIYITEFDLINRKVVNPNNKLQIASRPNTVGNPIEGSVMFYKGIKFWFDFKV